MRTKEKYPAGPGVNTLCTAELVREVIVRDEKTLGLEFVDTEELEKLKSLIEAELKVRRVKWTGV